MIFIQVCPVKNLYKKIESFGWNVIVVDGHDQAEIHKYFDPYWKIKGKPTCFILDTIKGKGVSFMVDPEWHAKAPSDEEYNKALKELGYESN